MKRTTPLRAAADKIRAWVDRSRTELERGGPLPKKNAKRQAKRKAEGEVYGPFFDYVKTLPCAVAGEGDECVGSVTGHHLRSVGAGGKDAGNLSPLCVRHHRMIHDIGPKAFDARFFNDLRLFADVLWRRFEAGSHMDGEV